MADAEPLVRAFYTALDEHNYDDLASLLAPDFTHYRPDRTLEGRDLFVSFMRDGRPMTDTTHELERVFPHADGAAVQGELLDSNDEALFGFVDVHTVSDEQITSVRTYTQSHSDSVE